MIYLTPYTNAAARALSLAVTASEMLDDGYIGSGHLLLGLLSAVSDDNTPCIAAKLLSARGVTSHTTASLLGLQTVPHPPDSTAECDTIRASAEPYFSPVFSRILARAQTESERFRLETSAHGTVVGTEHLLYALLCETDAAAHRLLAEQNLPLHELYGDVLTFLSAVAAEEAIFSGLGQTDITDADIKTAVSPSNGERVSDGGKTADDALPSYLTDMTAEAAAGRYDAVVGREYEEEAVLRILLHRHKNNPCLLGEAGVGKTAVVEGIAARIVRGDVPIPLRKAKIYALDLGAMLAGAKYRGDFEERLKRVLRFVSAKESHAILFLDEVHMLMGAGAAEGSVDAANLLKPALSRGAVRIIGATTRAEYDKTIARDGAMSRRFQAVSVEEPDADRAFRMLCALRPKLEQYHDVRISDEALHAAVSVSVRCLPEFFLPDKAIDLLDDACAAARTQRQAGAVPLTDTDPTVRRDMALLSGDLSAAESAMTAVNSSPAPIQGPSVTASDIRLAAERRTGIVLDDDTERIWDPDTFAASLKCEIFGQEAAITALTSALSRLRTGLRADERPRASFLFWGPQGVGKTALCERLSDRLPGGRRPLLHFDMSEYREAHTVSRLIGAPPGYIGHDDGGILTQAVRHRPHALLHIDNIDHAHPDVRQLLSAILDSGMLTDSRGTAVSFRNTVIIMTADTPAQHPLGFGTAGDDAVLSGTLSAQLSPEFLSHFDALIRFSPLSDDARTAIVKRYIAALSERLGTRGITVDADDSIIELLLRRTPASLGAHGLLRASSEAIETPIAEAMQNVTTDAASILILTADGNRVRLDFRN